MKEKFNRLWHRNSSLNSLGEKINTEKFEIVNLDGTNRGVWKFESLLVVQKELWTAAQELLDDKKKGNKALTLTRISVNDAQMVHVQDFLSAKEA